MCNWNARGKRMREIFKAIMAKNFQNGQNE